MALDIKFNKENSDVINAPPELVYDILTDYDSYGDWMALIARGKLMAIEGDLAIAQFDFTEPEGEQMAVECIHTKNEMVLTRPISGDAPLTRVQWDIEPAGDGKSKVSLSIRCNADLRWLKGPFSDIHQSWMDGLKAACSAYSSSLDVSNEAVPPLFHLVETEEGLVCWLNGKKYFLKEA